MTAVYFQQPSMTSPTAVHPISPVNNPSVRSQNYGSNQTSQPLLDDGTLPIARSGDNNGDVIAIIGERMTVAVSSDDGKPVEHYGLNGKLKEDEADSDLEMNSITPAFGTHDAELGANGEWVLRTYRPEYVKTLVAFVLLMFSAFANFFLLTIIHDIIPRDPLPDLVFILLPQQKWAWTAGDVLSTLCSVVAFICILLHRQRSIVLRRLFLIGALLYGLRAICMGFTFMPTSFNNRDEICLPQKNRTHMYAMEIFQRFTTYIVTLGLTSGQEQILCGDLMFSGHTVVFVSMYFTILRYTPRRLFYVRWFMTPVCYFGLVTVVISGGHYTIDVLVAYWLTSHIFWSYHHLFEDTPTTLRPKASLTRLWWYWVALWFEYNVPEGQIPNEWDWPFNRPKKLVELMRNLSRTLNEGDEQR